jgi:hypothetical protein
MLVKVLGGIDVAGAIAFLMLAFGIQPFAPFLVFCAVLLILKGMFALTGDVLSFIDLVAAILLIVAISFTLPTILLWIPALMLFAKGIVSFA